MEMFESEVSRYGISKEACKIRGGKSSLTLRGARACIVGLAVGALAASVLEAQEVSRERVGSTEDGPPFDVLVGLRGELSGLFSPGASLDIRFGFPGRPVWVSLGFLAQMIRWDVQYDADIRRDHLYLARVRLGLGRGEGPIVYGLVETGTGSIRTYPEDWRGRTYDLTGFGLGLGWTVRRVTSSVEVVLGGANRADPDLYGSLGIAFQYRIPGIGPG